MSILFLQYIMINLVLTKSSGPNRHAVSLTEPIFACFFVCHTDLGGGGAVAIAVFPPPPPPPHRNRPPPTLISICTTHLSRHWVDLPTDLWAIQPTCREVMDFKKAVSQRVKTTLVRQKLLNFANLVRKCRNTNFFRRILATKTMTLAR
jgi:hypothetical protein